MITDSPTRSVARSTSWFFLLAEQSSQHFGSASRRVRILEDVAHRGRHVGDEHRVGRRSLDPEGDAVNRSERAEHLEVERAPGRDVAATRQAADRADDK